MSEYEYDIDALKRDNKKMEDGFEKTLLQIHDALNELEIQQKTMKKINDFINNNPRDSPTTVTNIEKFDIKEGEKVMEEIEKKIKELAQYRDRQIITIKKIQKAIADHPLNRVSQGGKRTKRKQNKKKKTNKKRKFKNKSIRNGGDFGDKGDFNENLKEEIVDEAIGTIKANWKARDQEIEKEKPLPKEERKTNPYSRQNIVDDFKNSLDGRGAKMKKCFERYLDKFIAGKEECNSRENTIKFIEENKQEITKKLLGKAMDAFKLIF